MEEYLRIIQDRIQAPIEYTSIKNYCTATLLLLFAAIDGLGKLLHSNDKAGSNQRIRAFLGYMGSDYRDSESELLKLRHSLIHNSIIVESFLSHTDMGSEQHLKKMGAAGFIYVNTLMMYQDFLEAFNRYRAELRINPINLKRAADRLEWRDENLLIDINDAGEAMPSPPAPVEFIYAK